ncbi:cation-translocating P-type ATPase [Streptomyces sp. NPDC052051]|uniref:cation-translocating P-type ATPase n=1 Tax=Streptomyces sp. NPDC052051 TaxID=3154649 RepID=UPI00343F8EEE
MGPEAGVTRPSTATGLVRAAPGRLVRGAPAAVGAAAGALTAAARAGVHGADSAVRVARVVRNALPGDTGQWRSGARAHLTLRLAEPGRAGRGNAVRRVAQASRRVAEALAERSDVVSAYWDGGLTRLVITATEAELTDQVVERATGLAGRWGLTVAADPEEEFSHPGDPAAVRTAAAALAADVLGAGTAIAGAVLRLPHTPRVLTAVVTLLRENPRFRTWLTGRLGRSGMDLALGLANAVAHTAGGTPTALVLDGGLRACQLTERVARAVAFDATHDQWCGPARTGVPADHCPRPPLRISPTQEYAAHTSVGSVLAAVATELVKRDIEEAAEAVLAGSPKAARYGPAAFHSVLSGALARQGVLVREPERLRHLELAETLVLHPSALLTPGGADPWIEAVLDAARHAGLRVVMVDHPALADFTGLADRVVGGDRPLEEVVEELREDGEGGTVVTVARPASAEQDEVLAGLLGSDVAIALTDRDGVVVWGADVLAPHGLADAWRVLTAIPAARGVAGRSQTLARSGAALSGLLVAVRGARPSRRWPLPGLRHTPVDAATAAALLMGVRAALRVAAAPPPQPRPRIAWHALEPEEVQERLERQPEPQPEAERASDRARSLARALAGHPWLRPASGPVRWTVRLARAVRGELDDPLTPVLAVGSAASAILGSAADALLVVGALDLNALVGGVQRLRAERALSGLVAEQKRKARLRQRRGAHRPRRRGARTVDAAELRPGDIIELEGDDVVPADARLLWEDGLEIDESALTGESLPADKQTGSTPRAAVADRRCMVFEGTTVVAGRARAVVVEAGDRTEAARAVSLAARKPAAAGVQARLQELTRKALPLTLAGGAAVTGLSLLHGTPIRRAVSGGVSVAVAAVPEGLPLVATVAQLAAARRLSRQGVLVRTPRTLEALGRMDTLCFDKTGTLTENRLRVVRAADADGAVRAADHLGSARALCVAARACPRLTGEEDGRSAHATDEAVLDAAGSDPHWTQTEGRPFEAGRGYAAAVGRCEDGARVLVVKGAPEIVLPACAGLPDRVSAAAQALAGAGLRVLAVAERPLTGDERDEEVLEQALAGLRCTGLLALSDVPRETSTALVQGLRHIGVRPVMLTGDHPQTARAIAVELGWPGDTAVVTGDELAAADRARMLRDADVVARVAPEQKLQVIEALRDAGRVVGMVGDGANDAAAIRAADIGVGISARGSAAARNAADLVLVDSDLTVLIETVAEGRALWHGVADAIAILIGGNAGEVGFGILGGLLWGASPLSTRQMLLVNLFTDLFPAVAVAVTPDRERRDGADTGSEPGGRLLTSLLGPALIRQIRHRALATCLGASVAWLIGRFTPGTARRATTMALCALVGTQLAQTMADRRDSLLVRATALGSAAALVALVQTPGVSQALGCTPLGPVAWAGVVAAIAVAVAGHRALPGVERAVLRWWRSSESAPPETPAGNAARSVSEAARSVSDLARNASDILRKASSAGPPPTAEPTDGS